MYSFKQITMNRTVKTVLGLLTVGLVALTSCKQDDKGLRENEGTTYASVAINLQSDLRAEAGADENNYNLKGQWNGKDAIESVAVYIVSKGEVSFGEYSVGDFEITKATDDTNITITPKKAILTTPGEKEVYVLLNAPTEITERIKKSIPTYFKEAYAKAVEDVTTAQIAKTEADKGDIIMMTNAAESKLTVEDGITKEQALATTSPKNRASVSVKRAVARVLLTTTQDTYTVTYPDGSTMGTISNITYAVAQGEKAFYLSQKKGDQGVILTPAYEFMPIADPSNPVKLTNYDAQAKAYDYSDLNKMDRSAIVATDLTTALEIGKKSLEQSVFIFEASHKFGQAGETVANYTGDFRRGNTPYVLVRTKFVPAKFATENEKEEYEQNGDGTFYLGEDGLFYADNTVSPNPKEPSIRPDQKYVKYVNGKVLYYAFVNPDVINKTLNAPAYRNNIYHISVTGFKTIGTNWNPLYPEDPDTDNPQNPDPKPKDDPNTPPIKPDDPNTPNETYMAVDVTVIPWNVHTYGIELSI